MAKKVVNNKFIGAVSYWALLIAGLCKLISLIGASAGIIATIGDALLLCAVLLSAYVYAKTLTKGWRIAYWVIAIISIAGFVLTGFSIIK